MVAELNLDRVRLCRETETTATYLELEAELLPGYSEEVLDQLAEELQTKWGLLPQTRSKFERGLALFGPEPASRKEYPTVMDMQPPSIETWTNPTSGGRTPTASSRAALRPRDRTGRPDE